MHREARRILVRTPAQRVSYRKMPCRRKFFSIALAQHDPPVAPGATANRAKKPIAMPKLSFQYVRQNEPESLVEFLTRRFRYHSAETWAELVSDGRVKVNGRKVSPNSVLETRHKIVYDRPPGPEPPVDVRFSLVYEDEHILAVNKSGNIPTSPSGKYWENCLVHVLQKKLRLDGLRAVHRLDRETSGINLFGKHRAAASLLGKQFQRGAVSKTYSAILAGVVPTRDIYVSLPLADDPAGPVRIKQVVHPGGRESRTRFRLLAVFAGASLVEAVPLTGRTHQIRAHAAHLGHPVVGDKLYGASGAEFLRSVNSRQVEPATRQLLHATTLSFAHPFSGEQLTLRASDKVLVDMFLRTDAP